VSDLRAMIVETENSGLWQHEAWAGDAAKPTKCRLVAMCMLKETTRASVV